LQQPSTSASEGGGLMTRSESLTAESRLVHASPNYRLIKSRSESDLSQPESDEEGYALSGRRNVDLDLASSHRKRDAVSLSMLIFNWANEPTKSENCLGPFRCPDSNLSYEGQADVQLSENSSTYLFTPFQYFEEEM